MAFVSRRLSVLDTLRLRLVAWVVIAMLPAIGLALHSADQARRHASNDLHSSLLQVAREIALDEAAVIAGTRHLLAALAQVPGLMGAAADSCVASFAPLVGDGQRYRWMAVLDRDGRVVCGLPSAQLEVAFDEKPWFRNAVESGEFTFGGFEIGRVSNQAVAMAAQPVRDRSGAVVRVLVASIDLSWLGSTVLDGVSQDRTVTLIDGRGVVMARHPDDRGWVGRSITGLPLGKAVMAAPWGTVEAPGLSGEGKAHAFTSLPDTDASVIVGVPLDSIAGAADHAFYQTLAYLTLFGLLLVAAAQFGAHRLILAPIARLAETARALTRGDLDARTGLRHGPDEMGQLAACFDDMASSVSRLVEERTRALAEARAEAERANRAKSGFLAAASHDLRQPLQAMRLYLQVLEQRLTTADQRAVLERVLDSANATQSLLETLMGVSALEAGEITPEMQPLRLDELLRRVVQEHLPEAAERGLDLRARLPVATVVSDPVLVERMVRNLVKNALRYTERGGVLLACRRAGAATRIEVWDTGRGIAADKLDAIFEDFYQIGEGHGDGLGLGLSTVARMARLLGCEVTVRSRPGRGSVFAIQLPPAPARRQEPPLAAAS